ncbi:hypothetical protein DBV05_g11749 [Lasiodiplodia theobromae]|uniref:Uncharacterized protein n=1 Tax=Lasiodiplodia theobromae TaxID=45133 RepID=A0A5N5CW52_9PEZI|nr:hypothetical protein DBV05_g11749 [Lasiodiplodia theobromae]
MTSILFPTSDSPMGARTKQDYVPFMSDMARAASDAADALILFKNLVEGTAGGPDSTGFMAFDAHGGDTGCQLRAGMVLETFVVYRHFQSSMPDVWDAVRAWLDETVAKLQKVHTEAELACRKLLKHEVHPSKLGLPSVEKALQILGWDHAAEPPSLIDVLHQSLSEASDAVLAGLPPILCHHLEQAGVIGPNGRPYSTSTPSSSSAGSLYAASSCSSPETAPQSCPSSPPSLCLDESIFAAASTPLPDNKELPLTTNWAILEFSTLSRFIVFCHVLSKYKAFGILNGTIGARLAPDAAAEASYAYVRPYVAKKKAPGKPQRTLRELSGLQAWVADLSCAWLRALGVRSGAGMEKLIMSTVQQSDKGLKAAACYPGFLLAREAWAAMNETLLLVDRHFCADGGFHYNLFTATLTLASPPPSARPSHTAPLGLHVRWTIQHDSLSSSSSSDNTRPHLVIMGNSIAGGHAAYMSRIAAAAAPHHCTPDHPCADNEAHVRDVLAADHNRLALAFFAVHKAYAFPVGSDDGEIAFVEGQMDAWEEQGGVLGIDDDAARVTLKDVWKMSREEADEMGTGEGGMQTFAWQHAFLETRARVLRRVERWVEKGELMPLHCHDQH